MTNATQIRGWLLRKPKPVTVRLTTPDGVDQEVKPGRSYVRAAETIAALQPELLEALDEDGNLLRAWRPNESTKPAASSGPPPVPEGIASDPHALMLTHFANLLHRSYEFSVNVAFEKLVDVMEQMGARSENIERRLERTESEYREHQEDRLAEAWRRVEEAAPEAGDEQKQAMLGAFLQAAMANGGGGLGAMFGGARPPVKTNGKGKSSD